MRDTPDEGVDAVAGGEGVGRRQLLAQLDDCGIEADLLMGLAQGGDAEVGITRITPSAGE